MQLDSLDIKILNTLVDDGRASIESVAERIGLSPTPTRRRIKRLEDEKVITGYRAEIEPDRAGLEIRLHVMVKRCLRQFLDNNDGIGNIKRH